MITPDHSITFANFASVNFTLLHHTYPTAPDVRLVQNISNDNTLPAHTGEQTMSWTKGCYFGQSGQDDVTLCWQDMQALQYFCVGIESPERGFFKPIQSHYKTKYNDGNTNSAWVFPSDNPADPYTFPASLKYHVTVTSHALKDQLELQVTIEDRFASSAAAAAAAAASGPKADEKKRRK